MIPIFTHERLSGRIGPGGTLLPPTRTDQVHTFGPVDDLTQRNDAVGWYAVIQGGTSPSIHVELPEGAELVELDPAHPGDLVVIHWGRHLTAHHVRSHSLYGLHGFRRVEEGVPAHVE